MSHHEFQSHCDFSHAHYRFLLKQLAATGRFAVFSSPPRANAIYLRHDVDYSLERAIRMAAIEAEENVVASYFFLISSPSYNLLSADQRRLAGEIVSLGHSVGLHFEMSRKNDSARIQQELQILSSLVNVPVSAVSVHNPDLSSAQTLGMPPGVINTYDKAFFEKMDYRSDSNQQWRSGCPCQLTTSDLLRPLQLLIHPFWWSDPPMSTEAIFGHFINDKVNSLKAFLELNSKLYRQKDRSSE
jgi:hypothetical protein